MPKIIKNGITYAGVPSVNYDCEVSNVTLYAASWNTTTKVYTISDPRIDANTIQEYMPAVGITDAQLKALQTANIADGGQDTGHAYLKAYGDIPSIDIPIRVIFNPGIKTTEVIPSVAYGDTDISDIGDGTITGAISSIDSKNTYSTDETVIGEFNGSTLYRKIFYSTGGDSRSINVGIPFNKVKHEYGSLQYENIFVEPYYTESNDWWNFYHQAETVYIRGVGALTVLQTTAQIVIEYIK